ncbi:MFS transporter [Micromonospora sp. CB01531]|uniref:MFS transporter n=1 Tax=Micromonospora sp. CB01531 TaxID=1718947 RepID=UPI0009F95E99|nr:MFS transporter [Micromonospora sp. CB01531]
MAAVEEQGVRWRPGWTRRVFWQAPVGPIYVATLVLSVGRGAWYACWALFFLRSVGLSPAEFGFGITAAGVVGMVAGMPFGYLADRLGPREVLIVVASVQGLATMSLALVGEFWSAMLVTTVVVTVERAAPGIRIAVLSGLTSGADRLKAISNCHVIKEVGAVAGSLVGIVVLVIDSRAGYVALVLFCGSANLAFALLMSRVPHVASLRERKVKRKVLVLRDRPFLVLTVLNGVLALNWGLLDSGLPVWLTTHTQAPPWTMGVLLAFNGVVIVLLLNRFTRAAATVRSAGRLSILAGGTLAVSCLLFATTDGRAGTVVIALLFAAAAVHTLGELFFVGSGYGLSVGMTREEAHGEYQGMFGVGEGAAMMLAPGLLTALLAGWGAPGWLLLGGLFLAAGAGLLLTSRWSIRLERQRATAEPRELQVVA